MKNCTSCLKPKSSLHCESCSTPLCKDCELFLAEDSFSFFETTPKEIAYQSYCGICWDKYVAPAQVNYDETMEKAKKVFVFYTSQKRKPFALKRSRTQVSVKDIPDRDETIMRLAFLAALHNYNAIIETEIVSEKVRNHGYQKSNWRGKAIPILLDEKKLSIFED